MNFLFSLLFPRQYSCLHRMYSMQEDHVGYVQCSVICSRDLSVQRFGILEGPGTKPQDYLGTTIYSPLLYIHTVVITFAL